MLGDKDPLKYPPAGVNENGENENGENENGEKLNTLNGENENGENENGEKLNTLNGVDTQLFAGYPVLLVEILVAVGHVANKSSVAFPEVAPDP